jgi:hypothetical protein
MYNSDSATNTSTSLLDAKSLSELDPEIFSAIEKKDNARTSN